MPPQRPTLALREAARLINVWAEHGHQDTSAKALMQWATQTASLTPRQPRPSAVLDTLVLLDLVNVLSDGSLRAPEAIKNVALGTPDKLPARMRIIVLERLLHMSDCATPLRDAFAYARFDGASLLVPWQSVDVDDRQSPAWLWLQELDLADHQGERIALDESLRPFILDIDFQKAPITQAELEARIAAQRQRAWLAEELVVTLERERLTAAGAVEYAEAVQRISEENAVAGYDIESYETNGMPRRIEVKSCAGPRDRFYLTRHERETAERLRTSYWIAWIGWAARMPLSAPEVAWFRDPAALWKSSGSPWRMDYTDSVVHLVGNDLVHTNAP